MKMTIEALERGTAVSRLIKAVALSGGDLQAAAEVAANWADSPEVRLAVEKGVVDPMGISQGIGAYGLSSQFNEVFAATSVVGALASRFVAGPFRVEIPAETSALAGGWVSEEGIKPIGRLTFARNRLEPLKASAITVIGKELLLNSTPEADRLIRRLVISAVSRTVDRTFLSHDAAVAGESPAGASVNQGEVAQHSPPSLGDELPEMLATLTSWIDPVFILHPTVAGQLHAEGLVDVLPRGRSIMGYPLYVSPEARQDRILLVDLGNIVLGMGDWNVETANEATVLMDDGVSPATESTVNLWQQNLVAIRAERYINWAPTHNRAVAYLAI